MKITGLYRLGDINGNQREAAGIDNPGGGTIAKVFHLREALPGIDITNSIEGAGSICIAEVLWFTEIGDTEKTIERVEAYTALNALKILWTSDLEILRMPEYLRQQLFDASDIVGTLSDYSQQLIAAFTPKAQLLYDPIDIDMFVPGEKRREIFGIGQISPEKNVQRIVEIFGLLPPTANIQKTYIGSRNTWGGNRKDIASRQIEKQLFDVCDHFEGKLPRTKIPARIAPIWGYVADTRYDFSSYSMMEAMLSGCWLFTGRHLMYKERPGRRFQTAEEAITQILAQLEETPPESGIANEEARQFIVDRCSYDAFRSQFKNLIGVAAVES